MIKQIDKRIQRLNCYDMALFKTYIALCTLTIAKLWTPLLSLSWYWYAIGAVIVGIKPAYKFLKR